MTKGAVIDIEEYSHFVAANQFFKTYSVLDVIGDHRRTMANQEFMERLGLHPLPVFHAGTPYKELEKLCEKYDHFSLGGLVPYARRIPILKNHLDNCFAVIRRYFPKKVHCFGIMSSWALERYPFYSCDSSSWESGGRFGNILEGKSIGFGSAKGIMAFVKARNSHYKDNFRCNINVLLRAEERITRLWAKRGVIWKE